MNRSLTVAVALVCLSLSSCGKADKRITMDNFNKVKSGMTRAEVDALLGRGEDDPQLDIGQGSGVGAAVGVADPNSLGSGPPPYRWVMYGNQKKYILVAFNREDKVPQEQILPVFKKQQGLQ